MKEDKIITLVGKGLAEEGREFISGGEADPCRECEYEDVCIGNVEKGRRYRITKVRDVNHQCPVHKGGVKVVEVMEPSIKALVEPKKAMVGSKITFNTLDSECTNYEEYLNPEGLRDGDKCKVLNHGKKVSCNGKRLIIVELKRIG